MRLQVWDSAIHSSCMGRALKLHYLFLRSSVSALRSLVYLVGGLAGCFDKSCFTGFESDTCSSRVYMRARTLVQVQLYCTVQRIQYSFLRYLPLDNIQCAYAKFLRLRNRPLLRYSQTAPMGENLNKRRMKGVSRKRGELGNSKHFLRN